uniref:Small nuclear ribonucleoprotein (RUXX) n=1 Tax=uncultured marine thaumarchaeote SAT1000_06_A02 TaxID=1456359 RepID=A0A075I1B6_9ARCH|nr:small nuclear ribonucleoprotein (RUXX) [uncultured marine thaumarchaeote SAT1000_06_A02]
MVNKETTQARIIYVTDNNIKKTINCITKNTKKGVIVTLKSGVEYRGKMENVDSYMNLIMTDAEELNQEKVVGKFGRVIVRGNNVLFIKLETEF